MAAQVLSFFQRPSRSAPALGADWSQQELAEFYRVESALIRAGIRVGTDRGMSDENEPWFVFYRTDDEEVVIHFARIDGEYLIAGPAYEEIARGFDFSSLVRNMVSRHPLIQRSQRGDNIAVHPAALLVAVVGTAFFKSGEARAAESGASNPPPHKRAVLLSSSANAPVVGSGAAPFSASNYDTAQLPANQAVLVLAAALLASDFKVDNAGPDTTTRDAIVAAASALDFTGAPMMVAPSMNTADVVGGEAQVVTNTPVQTVSSVLSLVALLSTLPSPTDLTTPDAGIGGRGGGNGGDGGDRDGAAASAHLAAPGGADVSDWALEVRLGSGALPSVEVVQLVRAAIGDTPAQKISVIEVSKLPGILADLIAKGDHVDVARTQAQATPIAPIGEPTSPTVQEPAAPEPSPTHEAPVAVTPAPTPTPAAPAEQNHFASPDLVSRFINFFVAHTGAIEIMQNGPEIVMFDARVLHDVGAISLLHAMVFHFEDGGAIALVGDRSAFLDVGLT
ncbi:hypothetical protein [Caulobacter segnis]|uniref:Uncharacterized protein n=1 Tax=Caulobacter segnis TaxID=88688 RepID=A0A2W5XBZ1_9CAUL|nr:hypothetical protein [Caulobacter segnis]PZR34811.1 MAG: hypothetical protein DI526_09145 [Caulobacter segnis]